MKVLVVGNGSTGVDSKGNAFVNKHTGSFLSKINRFHKVSFAQFQVPYSKDSDLSDYKINNSGVRFEPISSLRNPFQLLKILLLIFNTDFVYFFYPGTLSRIFGLFSVVSGKKFGVYLRGQHFSEFWFDKYILRRAKFILTVSPIFKKELAQINTCVYVIKPMIDLNLDDLFLGEKRQNPSKWNILTVGRVEKRKGSYELIKIANLLKKSEINFEWHVVGGGEIIEELEKLILNYNLINSLQFHGQISNKSQLSEYYSKADLFIFLSHDEGFPRVLYEAMAFKVPIFTTFVGGIPGRMINEFNCFELPLEDPENAFKILKSKTENFFLLKEIACEGQLTVLKILEGNLLPHEDLFINQLESNT